LNTKALVNISTVTAHANPTTGNQVYSSTKASFAHLLQSYAGEIPADECRMISVHPGRIFTDGAKGAGYTMDAIPNWDNGWYLLQLKMVGTNSNSQSSWLMERLGLDAPGYFFAW